MDNLQQKIDKLTKEGIRIENEIECLKDQLSINASKSILTDGHLREGIWYLYKTFHGFELHGSCRDFDNFTDKFCDYHSAHYSLGKGIKCYIRLEDDEVGIEFQDSTDNYQYLGDRAVKAFILENKLIVKPHKKIESDIREYEEKVTELKDDRDRVISILSVIPLEVDDIDDIDLGDI